MEMPSDIFKWSEELQRFRSDLVVLLDRLVDPAESWMRGSVGYGAESSRRVCRALASEGFLVPHWPFEWGGGDLSPWHQLVVAEEAWRRGEPRAPQYLNVNFIGPAIIRSGTEEQKRRYLPSMAVGDALWCQGFSEPDAGSDLSRIRTRARAVDGGYVVTGTKLWISYADVAEHCFLLALLDRDGGDARRRRVVLLVPMNLDGIEVREVTSIAGPHTFHEIGFDQVFVASSALLGTEDDGWSVVTNALVDERVGAPEYVQAEAAIDRVVERARAASIDLSATTRAQVGHAYMRCHAARLLTYAAVHERASGATPTTQAFRARAMGRVARQAAADAIGSVLQQMGEVDRVDADVEPINAVIAGVAGGAYEIMLDLVANELTGLRRP